MRGWPRFSTADRVLAGALVTRRHFLKGAAVLGVAVAVAPRVLVQVPESYFIEPEWSPDIVELNKLLKTVYGPTLAQQQALAAKLYRRFAVGEIRQGSTSVRVRWA